MNHAESDHISPTSYMKCHGNVQKHKQNSVSQVLNHLWHPLARHLHHRDHHLWPRNSDLQVVVHCSLHLPGIDSSRDVGQLRLVVISSSSKHRIPLHIHNYHYNHAAKFMLIQLGFLAMENRIDEVKLCTVQFVHNETLHIFQNPSFLGKKHHPTIQQTNFLINNTQST